MGRSNSLIFNSIEVNANNIWTDFMNNQFGSVVGIVNSTVEITPDDYDFAFDGNDLVLSVHISSTSLTSYVGGSLNGIRIKDTTGAITYDYLFSTAITINAGYSYLISLRFRLTDAVEVNY